MLRYFTSRILSENLDIKLSRWKRWSREFLSPDPLGGKQSGYARQYSTTEALTVYLAGHMVGHLGISIPETKTVLPEVVDWMAENQMIPGQGLPASSRTDTHSQAKLMVRRNALGVQAYFIRQTVSLKTMARSETHLVQGPDGQKESDRGSVQVEKYIEHCLAVPLPTAEKSGEIISEKVLNLSSMVAEFVKQLSSTGQGEIK